MTNPSVQNSIDKQRLHHDLRELGVTSGMELLVHS
jgi:aminoglycoside N3'-acetyltransferase